MKPGKTVLTTGQVAKICCVAPRTVSKWFDEGHLHGYRIPGSKDRRIPLEALVKFMRANHIPLNGLETGQTTVLVADADSAYAESLGRALEEDGYRVATAGSAFDAGYQAGRCKPEVLVVNVDMPGMDTKAFIRFVRSCEEIKDSRLLAIGAGLDAGRGESLRQEGFAGWMSKPLEPRLLTSLIENGMNGSAAH
jgi:excisionase family DNA binding protein